MVGAGLTDSSTPHASAPAHKGKRETEVKDIYGARYVMHTEGDGALHARGRRAACMRGKDVQPEESEWEGHLEGFWCRSQFNLTQQ